MRTDRRPQAASAEVIGEYTYGRLWSRLLLACTLAVTGPFAGTYAFFLDDAAAPFTASTFVASNAVGVLYAIRALRLGVTVTDGWIEQRGLLVTRIGPWRSVRAISANAGGSFTLHADRDWILRRPRVRVGGSPPFEVLVADVRARGLPSGTGRLAWADAAPQRMTPVAIAALGIWGGLLAIAVTSADLTMYSARAERSVSTGAGVLDWEVRERDREPGHDTEVTVRFTSETGEVTARVHRSGEHDEREVVTIVYDPEDPHDADFFDQPNWRRQAADATQVKTGAAAVVVLSSIGFAVSGAIAALARLGARAHRSGTGHHRDRSN